MEGRERRVGGREGESKAILGNILVVFDIYYGMCDLIGIYECYLPTWTLFKT